MALSHHLEHLDQKHLSLTYKALTAVAVATALTLYFQSTLLKEIIGEANVGIFFAITYAVAMVSVFVFPRFLKRYGVRNNLLALLSATLGVLGVLAFGAPYAQLIALALYEVCLTLLGITLDVMLESFSKDALTGSIRGKAYTMINIAFVVAPSVAGILVSSWGFKALFSSAALVLLPLLCLCAFRFKFRHLPTNHQPPLRNIFTSIVRSPALSRIFFISFLLNFFYAWMIIYATLHLHNLGFQSYEIGNILSVMLLPFVLIQYPAGRIADKWLGEKELLTVGIVVIAGASVSMAFLTQPVMWHWMLALFMTRVGAALIEIMRDTYFFKQIDFRDVHLTSFFRDTGPLAYVVAPLLATFLLQFTTIPTLFIVLGIIMLTGLTASLTLKDTK